MVLVLGRRLLHINMHEADEHGAVPASASRGAASHISIVRSLLLPEIFNRAVQKRFCEEHVVAWGWVFFWSGVLFVETEALPQEEFCGNSQGGGRLPACTQRAGVRSFPGVAPKGLCLCVLAN